MNVIKTDKFEAHYQKMRTTQLTSKLDNLQKELETESNPMTPVLMAKSLKLEDDIYVYRWGKYRIFWAIVGKDILFVDILMRSWLRR